MENATGVKRKLAIIGVTAATEREEQLVTYLASGGYEGQLAEIEDLTKIKPLGIILDISPFSDDGWGKLLKVKSSPETRNIPVLPIYLSETGDIGGVFPVTDFFTLPVDEQYLMDRLAILGLTQEAETWDLQVMIASGSAEVQISKTLESAGFEIIRAYNGKEALALSSIHPSYFCFSSIMQPDMSAFELLEKFRLYPYNGNTPFFVLLKMNMREEEKTELSMEVAHLVSKKQLSCTEFLSHLRRRG
ncbi:MAG: histidine kinase [Geobacteraceae bacterium GWC2_48_7]|nr:MAG: histidine kinase [Geobacteraceae bacterium GWC2_48_7]